LRAKKTFFCQKKALPERYLKTGLSKLSCTDPYKGVNKTGGNNPHPNQEEQQRKKKMTQITFYAVAVVALVANTTVFMI